MRSYEELLHLFNSHLKTEILDSKKEPSELYAPVKYSLSAGGKRIRPVLLLMAANLFTDNIEKALAPALGIEIFHNFTLLHDDIMDNSPIRRNQPTVHVKWNNNAAILSGDAMSILAQMYIARVDKAILDKVLEIYNRTALEVCEGQQHDIDFEHRLDVSVDEYLNMIRLKTSVLIAASAQIGALVGGSSIEDAERIYLFALNLGIAFQLQDDYLDSFGDKETFGKRIGGDIIANKKTFLLIKALELAEGKVAESLRFQITNEKFDEAEKIEVVSSIFKELQVDVLSRKLMEDYFEKALSNIKAVSVSSDRKNVLISFAEKLWKRER